MVLLSVPVVDISPFRSDSDAAKRSVAREVADACKDIGFVCIKGHGIPSEVIEATDRLSREFFDLPLSEKMNVVRPSVDVTRGYVPLATEALAMSRGVATDPDLNESFMIGPVDADLKNDYFQRPEAGKHFHPNLWPEKPKGLKEAYTRYYLAMGALAAELMSIFAIALDLPEDFFETRIDKHISRLRVRNYPEPKSPPKPGQLRAGAHCDYGSLTILKAEANPGGLQVFNKQQQWVDVPIVKDTFIVNLGELMAHWTNDTWVSSLHRVVNPPSEQASGSRRQSIVFFHNPNYDADVTCFPSCCPPNTPPKYPPTTSGQHLIDQFVKTQQKMLASS